jgi:Xaa-Pro aminopeptidase
MISTPKEELIARLRKVQQVIVDQQADACIITTPVNQFYLNDFIFNGYFYILPESDPLLFIKHPIGINGNRVEYIRKPEQIPDMLNQYNLPLPRLLLLEADALSYTSVIRLQTALNMPKIANISQKMREIRAIKSDFELNQIRESAKIHAEVYSQIPTIYRPGMTDIDFQIELEYIMRKAGSLGIFRSFGENMDIFMGSILTGNNAQTPSPYDYALGGGGISPLLPLGANGTPLKNGTTLMVDMAGNYRPYMDDMTRTFAIGKVPEIAYHAHQVSIDIHNKIWETAKPGTLCSDLYLLAEKKDERKSTRTLLHGNRSTGKIHRARRRVGNKRAARTDTALERSPSAGYGNCSRTQIRPSRYRGRWDRKHLYCQRKRIGKNYFIRGSTDNLVKISQQLYMRIDSKHFLFHNFKLRKL